MQGMIKRWARNVQVNDSQEICKEHVINIQRIGKGYPWNIQGNVQCTRNVQGLCRECASIVLRMCKDAQGLCKESTIKNVKGICLGASRLVQKECKE